MRLYHFTNPAYVESIQEHGILPVGAKFEPDSQLPVICSDGVVRPAAGIVAGSIPPPVFPQENNIVWLTRKFEPEIWPGEPRPLWSTGARIHVDVPNAMQWARAAQIWQVPDWWQQILGKAGDPLDWYVVDGPIPPERIKAIDFLDADNPYTLAHIA